MQKKWLLEYEIGEVLRIAKSRAPRKNKNQEKDTTEEAPKSEKVLAENEKKSIRHYNALMPLASSSLKKMDKIIKKAVTIDTRESGVGNYGGHVARSMKTPGPLNGKEVFEQPEGSVTSPFYVKLKKKKIKKSLDPNEPLNPPWSKNFVRDHEIPKFSREDGDKTEDNAAKLEMQRLLSPDDPSGNVISPVKGHESTDSWDQGARSISTKGSLAHISPPVLPVVTEDYAQEWGELEQELIEVAEGVPASDLAEIASWLKPPVAAVDIIGYICILLGINPDWATAKKLLLKNIPLLHQFITKVKPTRIPIDRWVAAAQWRQDHIPLVNHFGVEKVNKALSRLTRWVLFMNRMWLFFQAAHDEEVGQQRSIRAFSSDAAGAAAGAGPVKMKRKKIQKAVREPGAAKDITPTSSFEKPAEERHPRKAEDRKMMRDIIRRNSSLSLSSDLAEGSSVSYSRSGTEKKPVNDDSIVLSDSDSRPGTGEQGSLVSREEYSSGGSRAEGGSLRSLDPIIVGRRTSAISKIISARATNSDSGSNLEDMSYVSGGSPDGSPPKDRRHIPKPNGGGHSGSSGKLGRAMKALEPVPAMTRERTWSKPLNDSKDGSDSEEARSESPSIQQQQQLAFSSTQSAPSSDSRRPSFSTETRDGVDLSKRRKTEPHPHLTAGSSSAENFWHTIEAAYMVESDGTIRLANGKDIKLYEEVLLPHETITSTLRREALTGSDLALTVKRKDVVEKSKHLIDSYIGKLIRTVSTEIVRGMSFGVPTPYKQSPRQQDDREEDINEIFPNEEVGDPFV